MNIYAESTIARLVYLKRKIFPLRKNVTGDKAILVVRPDAIGDLTLTVPFLRNLRRAYPKHIITLVTDPLLVNLMELCPYVDEILTFSKRAKKHKFMTNLRAATAFVRDKLPRHTYELAMVPAYANPDSYCEAWISFFSGAKRRLAYTEKLSPQKSHDYMGTFDMYFTDLCRDDTPRSEVEGCLGLLKYLGAEVDDGHLELWTSAEDKEKVAKILGEKKKTFRVSINLSTSNITKDWPVENFVEVGKRILTAYDAELVLIGAGESSQNYGEIFAKEIPEAVNLINATTIRETIEVLRHSDYYLGGDTGPMHLAAACKLGGVGIFKTSKILPGVVHNPAVWFAPWQSKITICQPEKPLPGCEGGCEKACHCIRLVTPDEVFAALSAQMRETLENPR